MVKTLEEEAKSCPDCGEAGFVATTNPTRDKGRVDFFECANTRCSGFEMRWAVQVNPDGTIPQHTHNVDDKIYKPLTSGQLATGQRLVEDAVQRDLRGEI